VILVVNAGSSSLKLSAVDPDGLSVAVASLEESPQGLEAVAHRIVHGGQRFRDPVVIDDIVRNELEALSELAPLHNALQVSIVDEARRLLPDAPHVAVFDTAFHSTMPDVTALYAVPRRWADEWGIRRYGFHGLSVQWASEQVTAPRLVVCHLGAGCSVTAVLDGRSVATTMGFSPLEGVPMATRSGSIDPAVVLYLIQTNRLEAHEIGPALEEESGLLGLSGSSGRVEELERSPDPRAKLALEIFTHGVASAVASMVVSLGGLDALVFTGGVGENSPSVRRAVCGKLAFLGLRIDEAKNTAGHVDAEIGGGAVAIHVIRAREDVVAARAVRALLRA
jgi:acetate kinase